MPGLCVRQSWSVKNGSAWSPKECCGRSWLSEWCARTPCGRDFPKEEGGEYWGRLFPWKKVSWTWGHFDDSRKQLCLPNDQPISNKREKTSGQELGGGVKAIRIFPAEMYVYSVFINWEEVCIVWVIWLFKACMYAFPFTFFLSDNTITKREIRRKEMRKSNNAILLLAIVPDER